MAFHDEDCSSVSTTAEYEEKVGFLLETTSRKRKSYIQNLHVVSWISQLVLFVASVTLFVNSKLDRTSFNSCVRKQSTYSPALDAISDDYKAVRFNGSLFRKSPFTSAAGPEADAEWRKITPAPYISIPIETIREIGASETSTQIPEEWGGGYLAEVSVFHQLHCINLLWMGTHLEYYQNHSISWTDPPWMIRQHLDHCADILRQKIQCDADASLLTFDWVKGFEEPFENFNSVHKCRDFNALKSWVEDHAFTWPDNMNLPMVPGSVILDTPP